MKESISLKTSIDVARIRRACRIVEETFRRLDEHVARGVRTSDLERIVSRFLRQREAASALKGYKGFPKSICASVNNVAAHGIPDDTSLEEGDVVSIDITVSLEGWHGDGAWTYVVGEPNPDAARLVRAAWRANMAGIRAVEAGAHFGDVGAAISEAARELGCTVVQDYVGHGIGEKLHEDPLVPNYGEPGQGMRIVPGMVFTVEPIVSLGGRDVSTLEDGWTVVTADGSLCAQFEHTLAVFSDRVEVLTLADFDQAASVDRPPFF